MHVKHLQPLFVFAEDLCDLRGGLEVVFRRASAIVRVGQLAAHAENGESTRGGVIVVSS